MLRGNDVARFRSAIPKGLPFWKPSFMVVAGNSSWYCHNQTTDPNPNPNPNRIPNRKLSQLEMAENGGPSEWRPFGMAAPRNGGLTPAAMISRFLSPQPDTSLHCETTDTGLVYRVVWLFIPQLLLVRIAPTHGGMARLSWPGWFVTYRDGLPVHRRSPIQVLTGPGTSLIETNALTTEPNHHTASGLLLHS